jgi:NAD(P)-dependent dehydrogenase (short-subunit alcohol dehydrogenase family)
VVPEDLHYQKRFYNPWLAYGQSKLANLLYAKSLADDLADTNITPVAVYPGIISTGLWRENKVVGIIENMFFADKNIPQGASTTIYACLSPLLDEYPGAYLVDCTVAEPSSLTLESYTQKEKKTKDLLWKETKKQLEEACKQLKL